MTNQEYEAEIARLTQGYEDLKAWVEREKKSIAMSEWHGYTTEEYIDSDDIIDEINKITGVEK